MVQGSRLQHDLEVGQRATLALLGDLVLVAFLVLALGTTVYDVGKWVSLW